MACQICGKDKPTILAEFSGNIGALIMRFERSIRANMCRSCVHKQFWKFTAMNFFLGWWGVISFFVTPLLLFINTAAYLKYLHAFRKHAASLAPSKGDGAA
jgi:hypothetical protein